MLSFGFCCSSKPQSKSKRKRKDRQIRGFCQITKNPINMIVIVIPTVFVALREVPKDSSQRPQTTTTTTTTTTVNVKYFAH